MGHDENRKVIIKDNCNIKDIIQNSTKGLFAIYNSTIGKVNILGDTSSIIISHTKCTSIFTNVIGMHINSIEVDSVTSQNIFFTGNLKKTDHMVVKNTSFNKLTFDSFYNEGKLYLDNLTKVAFLDKNEPGPKISFKNSHLGQAYFYNIDFNNFSSINLLYSTINQINTANVFWPQILNIYGENDTELIQQVKQILINHSQTYELYKLKVLELDSLRKKVRFKNNDKENFIILWFNYLTNKNRLSWWRAFYIYFASAIIFYALFMIFQSLPIESWGYLFVFLNIAHSLDFVKDICGDTVRYEPAALAIDVIARVWLAAIAYQFVSAFRRFAIK